MDLVTPELIEGALAGLMTNAVSATCTRLINGANGLRKKDRGRHLDIVRGLDSYAILDQVAQTGIAARLSLPNLDAPLITKFLQGLRAQSLVHEMLSLRLVASPEVNSLGLQRIFILALDFETDGQLGERASIMGEQLFNAIDDICIDMVISVSEVDPATLDQLRTHAAFSLMQATISAMSRQLDAHVDDASIWAADRDFEGKYREQLKFRHGTITPPDLDRRKRVALADLYVTPEILTVTDEHHGNVTSVADSIEDFWVCVDRAVLLGEPGGGKSTATGALIHHLALHPKQEVPFLVILRDYAPEKDASSIVEYIERRLSSDYQLRAPSGYVERQLLNGRGAVFFDGLDELLDTSDRRDVTDAVESFSRLYPYSKVFVTSRLVGYEQAPMDAATFSAFRLANFSSERVATYVNNWFRVDPDIEETQAASLVESFLRESESVEDLRRNPLMLALMCIIYRGENSIPRNRPDVYEKCATLLFDKWDGHRHIDQKIAARDYIDEGFKHLALWMLKNNKVGDGVRRRELISETSGFLELRAFEDAGRARRAAEEFVDFCKGRAWVFSDAGTTADGEELYKFTHRTFMEYFAAYELTRICESPERLARELLPRVARQEWDMVGQLAVAIIDRNASRGAERVISVMLADRRRRTEVGRGNILSFVARCFSFVMVPPEVIRRTTREVFERALKDPRLLRPENECLGLLLNNLRLEHLEYADAEMSAQALSALDSTSEGDVTRCLLTLFGLRLITSSESLPKVARSQHYTEFTKSIIEQRDAVVRSALHNDWELHTLAFRNGYEPVERFFAANLGRVSRGEADLLDFCLKSTNSGLGILFLPLSSQLMSQGARRGGGGSHANLELLRLIWEKLQVTPTPWGGVHARSTRIGEYRIASTPITSGALTPELAAALVLWCCFMESLTHLGDAVSARRLKLAGMPVEESGPTWSSLLRARDGDEEARQYIATLGLPTVLTEWSLEGLNFLRPPVSRQ